MQSPSAQWLSLPCSPKSRGVYTGARLARDRPEVYTEIVELLGYGTSLNCIARHCRVSRHTIRAVREREADSVAQAKIRLAFQCSRIAEAALYRIEEALEAREISLPLLVKVCALATDVFLKLTRDVGPVLQPPYDFTSIPQSPHCSPARRRVNANVLPNGGTISDSGA